MRGSSLVKRDPALAILMGAIGGSYEGDADFGVDFGDDMGVDFGDDVAGDFGDDMGADFGAHRSIQKFHRHAAAAHHTKRVLALDPNRGSSRKIEGYLFTMSQVLTFGTAAAISMTNQPDVTIRPQRALFNVGAYGLAYISEIKVANVSAIVGGSSSTDAAFLSGTGVGVKLDLPTLTPANRLSITGNWTTYVPPGYVAAASYTLVFSAIGPAEMAG